MEIIVPAAGLSSRFPNTKPKYLLFDYSGQMMLHGALRQFLDKPDVNITVGILKEHDDLYNAREFILKEFDNKVNVVVLPELTRGPAETVIKIIEHANIDLSKPLLIKDCDSYFDHEVSSGNYVCISRIQDHQSLTRVGAKSFVITNNQNVIQNIVEKSIVSDSFCVGGYKFEQVKLFMDSYLNICNSVSTEIFVSHVIEYAINQGNIFLTKPVYNYTDVGTLDEWVKYNDKPVIFCDIDGTLIVAQSRYGENSYDVDPVPLTNNIETIKRYQNNGSQLIFTTSRPEYTRQRTIQILNKLGFTEFQLLTGLNNSARLLINDYNSSNPFPRASAVNIKRDSDNLSDYL